MIVRAHRPETLPPASDRFVVVEASAGTGKTYFLEHRVVDLILAGAELGQILLVTFMEKAVAELRLRIRDLLDRLARQTEDTAASGAPCWEIDDAARARLRAAVTAFDHAPIFTIHGFCHRVLVEDAFAAHRLFQQTQVADEVAFEAAFSALLREQLARVPADRELLAAYLETGKTVDDLRTMLLRCARTGASLREQPSPGTIAELGADLASVFGSPEACARVRAWIAPAQAWRADGWLAEVAAALPADGVSPARVVAAVDELRDRASMIAKHLKRGAPVDVVDVIRRAVTCVSLDEIVAAAFLPRVLARMIANKAERGQFDYDDMLALVDLALRDDRGSDLAARLRARTPWVMIDEFQDTDPVQWRIFRAVWMHAETRGLTIVGDPKQAIYGFRGADVDTYLHARDEMLRAGATRVALEVNRRSTAQLVDATNAILIGSLAMPMLQGKIQYDEPVRAAGEVVCADGEPITVFQLAAGGKDANKIALGEAIATEIERLRVTPPAWRDRRGEVAFSLGQIMVLTRTNSESADIAARLRARGLPCALIEPDKLFETREASELAAVLAAIAAPRDRSARMRALRTRYFDVAWPDLMKVVDAPDHHPAIARLYDWAALAARRQYESLFRRLVEDSRFAERALVLGGGERALANTWHLIELVLEEVARSRSDLHELVVQLRRWIDDRSDRFDDRDVQRAETDADAIRVLTVHKAKGLEAPYVFLYGGFSPPGGGNRVHTLRDATDRLLVIDPRDPDVLQRIEKDQDAENERLAYVALTRAQIRMYLPLYGDKVTNDRAMYHSIQRCLAPQPNLSPALFRTEVVAVGGSEAPAAPANALADFIAASPPSVGELAPLGAIRGGLVTLSYTRIAHEELAPRAGDAPLAIEASEFDVDDPRGEVAPDELPPGAASGLLLHDMFEIADLAHVRDTGDAAAWSADRTVTRDLVRAARARGIAERYLGHAARVVHGTLTRPLALVDGDALPPLVAAPALAREVEFAFTLPDSTPVRGLARGFIDALVAWDDALWVLDYKSDVLGGDDLAAAARARVAERYEVQAKIYGLAAERLRGPRRLAGILFAFVRHDLVVPVRTSDELIASWSDWLGRLGKEARP